MKPPIPTPLPEQRPLVLLVEDDGDVAQLVRAQLEREGVGVEVNRTGAKVLEQLAALEPQMLILDLMLPQANGLEILARVRESARFRSLPVLVLTALGSEAERVRGLDLGADDYVAKPFSPRELAARVRARLRGAPEVEAAPLRAGVIELDLRAHAVRVRGQELELSDTEFRLLAFFLRSPGRTFTRREIVAGVWTAEHYISDRAIDVYMLRLRGKIEANPEKPELLVSMRGKGYRLNTPGSGTVTEL